MSIQRISKVGTCATDLERGLKGVASPIGALLSLEETRLVVACPMHHGAPIERPEPIVAAASVLQPHASRVEFLPSHGARNGPPVPSGARS